MEFNATFIVSLISFAVFIVIMNTILYAPINDIVQKRKEYIDENYNTASKNCAQKESILEKRNNDLKNAHDNAREQVAIKKEEINKKRNQAVSLAKQEVKKELDEKTSSLVQEQKQASEELKHQIVGLAQLISDKFIESDKKVESNDELVAKILHS